MRILKCGLSCGAVEVGQLDRIAWSMILRSFGDGSIRQTWSYGAQQWGEHCLSHLVLRDGDGEPIAAAQVGIPMLGPVRIGLARVEWGPMWRRMGRSSDAIVLREALKALRDEYVGKRGFVLSVRPQLYSQFCPECGDIFEQQGFVRDRTEARYSTLLASLTAPEEQLRAGLLPKWRNQLARAERSGIAVRMGTDDRMFAVFLQLLDETTDRKHFTPGADCRSFARMQQDLPEPLKMRVIIAERAGLPLAGAVCSAVGDTGVYLFGATARDGLKVAASNLVQWRAMRWLCEQGCEWYDLGGVDERRNPGVFHFKRGIAGKNGIMVVSIGSFVASRSRLRMLLMLAGRQTARIAASTRRRLKGCCPAG